MSFDPAEEEAAVARETTEMVAACFSAGLAERGLEAADGYGYIIGVFTPNMSELEVRIGTNAPDPVIQAGMLLTMGAAVRTYHPATETPGDDDGSTEDHGA